MHLCLDNRSGDSSFSLRLSLMVFTLNTFSTHMYECLSRTTTIVLEVISLHGRLDEDARLNEATKDI